MNNVSHDKLPQIVIFGAGSIGCYIGGCLMAANSAVSLIGRPRIQQQLSQLGMHLTDWKGRDTQLDPDKINFSLSASILNKADYILVTVKSGDTKTAATEIAKYAKPEAIIISFQNGLHNTEVLQQQLIQHTVLKGMVPFNVISNDGHFHCGTEGDLAIEDKQNSISSLIPAFEQAKLPIQISDDLKGVQWGKLLMNLNNSVNALSGIPLRDQIYNATYRKILAAITSEALQILKAAGIKPARTGKVIPALSPYILSLPNWLFKRVASAMLKIDPEARSSMYEDLILGRTTEIDFLNGEIVKLAHQLNLSAPINSAIVKLVKQAEEKKSGSPMIKADELLQCISKDLS